MNNNLLITYINLREQFDNILSDIDYIDVRNEWSDWYKEHKYTYEYYKMILDCECFDGGFITSEQHKTLINILNELYFLKDDDHLFIISHGNENEDLVNKIQKAPALISKFKELFDSIYK